MTNQEAIKELQEDKALYMPEEWIEALDRDTPDGRLITALDMAIKALEQEPKTGHWILTDDDFVYCSECEDSYYPRPIDASWNYCPHCGCRMVEQESEETETWNGIHAQITAPKGTFERIFNEADDDNDI